MTTIIDVITNPFWTGIGAVQDFWAIAIGTREEKVVAASKYIPIAGLPYGVPQNVDYAKKAQEIIKKQIAEQQGAAQFWRTNTLGGTDIKVPDLPDVGNYVKWIGIGAVALVAIWAYGQVKKK